jgi:hypothetical protein
MFSLSTSFAATFIYTGLTRPSRTADLVTCSLLNLCENTLFDANNHEPRHMAADTSSAKIMFFGFVGSFDTGEMSSPTDNTMKEAWSSADTGAWYRITETIQIAEKRISNI